MAITRSPPYHPLGLRPRPRYHVTLQRESPAGETPLDWGAEGASRPESLRQKDRSGTLTLESDRLAIHRRGYTLSGTRTEGQCCVMRGIAPFCFGNGNRRWLNSSTTNVRSSITPPRPTWGAYRRGYASVSAAKITTAKPPTPCGATRSTPCAKKRAAPIAPNAGAAARPPSCSSAILAPAPAASAR